MKLNLQIRFVYDSLQDSEDAFGIEVHNTWLEYKPGLDKTIRIGHFDPAIGSQKQRTILLQDGKIAS